MSLWIVIHLIILFLFLFLFLWSMSSSIEESKGIYNVFLKLGKKVFLYIKKHGFHESGQVLQGIRLLHPAEDNKRLVQDFYMKKLATAFIVFFIGNLFGLLLAVMAMGESVIKDGNLISRNPYGQGTKEIELEAYINDEKLPDTIPVTIEERQYTEEEIQNIFEKMNQELETAILGENDSLEVVCYDLKLVTSLKDYPVDISWQLDNYEVMNSSGKLREDALVPEGTPVLLTASLNYFNFQGEHSFYAMVYPPEKTVTEELSDKISKLLLEYQKKTVNYEDMILPEQMDNMPVRFHSPKDGSNMAILMLVLAAGFVIYTGKDKDLDKEVKKREREMLLDYPEIVSKITLLLGAGMTIRGAFEKTALEYETRKGSYGQRYAYEEMIISIHQLSGGVSEAEVYVQFGDRCHIGRYIKLGALLAQNLRKGTAGLLQMMEAEEKDAFEDRKSLARKLGEEAGTKLLLPMGIMLVVVMVIVIFPAFLSFRM